MSFKSVVIDGVTYIPVNSALEALSKLNPLSSYSSNGVNVWGDEKSIKAVTSAFHYSAQIDQYRAAFDENKRALEDKIARVHTALYGEKKKLERGLDF